ncbi:MAG: toxin-antitoxin system YwqK family antitoxin [bacterium]
MQQKTLFLLAVVCCMLSVSCTSKTKEYRSDDGAVVATCQYSGHDSLHAVWQFKDANGNPLVANYDSLRIIERGPEGHPQTVCFHIGNEQRWMQFYTTMQLRSEGKVVNGQREGAWTFYYPDGIKQCEATFVAGLEEGPYHVYRENGVPYYIGQYHNGERTGTWEIYNPDGSLAGKQEY